MNDKSLHKEISCRIRHIRQLYGLTQASIARIVCVNYLTYRGYENCKSNVPIVILIRLADYYGISMDYLTGRIGYIKTVFEQGGSDYVRMLQYNSHMEFLRDKKGSTRQGKP